jgi:transposase-like protein
MILVRTEEGAMGRGRRRFTSEQKAGILREHLVGRVSVADLCDKHGLRPTVFYRWQKEMFENLVVLFERTGASEAKALRTEVDALKGKLARKDAIIAEIMEDYVAAKKTLGAD